MRLVVVGMGYVGIPVAAAFAETGMHVVGLDVQAQRVQAIAAGQYPIEGNEPGLPELLRRVVGAGALTASTDAAVVADADAVLVCVQTPFDADAMEPDYQPLQAACAAIGAHLRSGTLVVVESTLAPGTMQKVVQPALEKASSMRAGADFLLGHCPERVMPGKLLQNLRGYDRVLGGIDGATHKAMRALYTRIVRGALTPTDLLTAEVVKSFENTYRDVEIALANEFAQYCDTVGVDFFAVRELVNKVEDRNLHLPGAGVGGHCIPKDTYLLAYGSKGRFTPKLMLHARRVNDAMPPYVAKRTLKLLRAAGVKEKAVVAVLGLSYLGDSDDTRMTPSVPLVRALQEAGCRVRVHDPFATSAGGVKASRDLAAVTKGADAVIIATAHKEYRGLDWAALKPRLRHAILVDGRHVVGRARAEEAGYVYAGVGEGRQA
jgi:UDP-N-acetyl-D-mannosaminuronic acid dehydrogenase